MKKSLLITTLVFLLGTLGAVAQTTVDTEPANNTVPGDSLKMPVNNNANLSASNDVDYFKIRTTKVGVLTIAVSGTNTSMQTRVSVYNADGVSLEGFRDAAFAGDNVSLDFLTQYVGVYYLRIHNVKSSSPGASPYNLNVTMDSTDVYEFNNSIASLSSVNAMNLSYNESNPTSIDAKLKGYHYVSNGGNFSFAGLTVDQDYYKITTGSKMGVIVMKLSNVPSNLKFRIEMLKDDGTTQLGLRDGAFNGDTLRFELLTQYSGIYYVRIRANIGTANGTANSSNSIYTLNLSLDTLGVEYNDDIAAAGSFKAMAISANEQIPTVIKAHIRGHKYINNGGIYDFPSLTADQDIYKITTGKLRGAMVMKLASVPTNLRLRIEMIKDDGITSLGYRDAGFNGDTLRFEYLTQYEGIYYVRVRNINTNTNLAGNTSAIPYTLNVFIDTLGREFNDNIASIVASAPVSVSLNESVPTVIKGKIRGYYYVSNGGLYDFANLTADQDYYKITTTKNMGVLVMRLSSVPPNLRFRIEMIKDDGITLLGYRDASINGDSMRFELLTQYAGVYYIRIRNINAVANGIGNSSPIAYTLNIALDTLGAEFNDNIAAVSSAAPISLSFTESNPTQIKDRIRGHYYVNNGGSFDFASLTADQDYYKITTGNNTGVIVMKLSNVPSNLKFRIEMIKDDGLTLLGYRDANINGDTLRFELLTEYAGIYYIRLRNINGAANGTANSSVTPYNLNLSLDTLGMEFNDNVAQVSSAAPVSVSLNESMPTVLKGKIRGYYYVNNGGNFDFINLSTDQDFYKITTGGNTGILVLRANPVPLNLRLRIELIKEDGVTSLGYKDAVTNGDSLRFEVQLINPGVHYIRVRNVNGVVNGSGNSSPNTYNIKMAMETGLGEFNDAITLATPLNVNDTVSSKIRGHYRTNFGTASGADFFALTPDVDYFKINDGCYHFMSASLTTVPVNMRMRMTVYDTSGFVIVSKTATNNGDKISVTSAGLTKANIVKYIKVENINTANDNNTSMSPYVLSTDFADTLYSPIITPALVKPCKDSVILFTSNSIDDNHWSTGDSTRSIFYQAKNSGFVTLQQFSTGCYSGIDTAVIQLVPPPVASFSYIANLKVFAFTSNSPGATAFKWNFGDKKTSTLANPTNTYALSGTYTVKLITTNACGIDSTTQTVSVSSVGIRSVNNNANLTVFPNPNNGSFLLRFNQGLTEKSELGLYNALGQLVFAREISIGTKELELKTELPAGVYLMEIKGASHKMTQRVVITEP